MRDPFSFRLAMPSRRGLMAAVPSALAFAGVRTGRAAPVVNNEPLRLGLIGCGGRGTGAATQALRADKNTKLVAVGDAFADRLENSLQAIGRDEGVGPRVDVPKERQFVGFDAYKAVLDAGVDVVILATPPHFRPIHMEAAVKAGKHVFAEKPCAVDAPGVRRVLAAAEEARAKNLNVVSGLCWRYDPRYQDVIKRIHQGAIGDVRAILAHDFRGPIWTKPRQKDWTDMEWHMRNWYYFTWLSGDFNVEQHVHILDQAAWIMKQYPTSATGTGGRAQRNHPSNGEIYDHHAVVYSYDNGVQLFSTCRQYGNAHNDSTLQVIGAKGDVTLTSKRLAITTPKRTWEAPEEKVDKFQAEHDALFASIRNGRTRNDGEYMAKSSLMGIMGRMATYTGQKVTWDQAMASTDELKPAGYDWKAAPPKVMVAVPGTVAG